MLSLIKNWSEVRALQNVVGSFNIFHLLLSFLHQSDYFFLRRGCPWVLTLGVPEWQKCLVFCIFDICQLIWTWTIVQHMEYLLPRCKSLKLRKRKNRLAAFLWIFSALSVFLIFQRQLKFIFINYFWMIFTIIAQTGWASVKNRHHL